MADDNFYSIHIQAPDHPEAQDTAPLYYNVPITPAPSIETQVLPVEGITEIESQSEVSPLLLGLSSTRKRRRRRRAIGDAVTDQQLQFSLEDVPPWYLSIILGFQQILIMLSTTVTYPAMMAKALCIGEDDYLIRSELIGTIFFVSGICTLLQTTIGVRLPIMEGGSYMFAVAGLAILRVEKWKCPGGLLPSNTTTSGSVYSSDNATSVEEIWKPRIREIQGAMMVASLFQVVIGFSGIMGAMLRFIGPLVIAPTVALTGIALFDVATGFAAKQWWIALVYLRRISQLVNYTNTAAKLVKALSCIMTYDRGVGVSNPALAATLGPLLAVTCGASCCVGSASE